MTPGCRLGFCGLPPLHVSGASFWCVGSCVVKDKEVGELIKNNPYVQELVSTSYKGPAM